MARLARSPARRRRRTWAEQAGAALLACSSACCGAVVLQDGVRTFTGGRGAAHTARRPDASTRQASDPERPWKSVVFKMPRKKPERPIETNDDAYTKEMRERLKSLNVQPEDNVGKQRGVNEAKIDDLILKETDDAKINGLYTMWYMDKANDRMKEETERPDKHVLRKRYQERKDRLEGKAADVDRPIRIGDSADGPGFLRLRSEQDLDDLFEQAGQQPRQVKKVEGEEVEEAKEDSDVVDVLTAYQKRSMREDRGSKRIVKSPQQRKEEYEESKVQLFATTSALGVTGSLCFYVASGFDAAFSFGLGVIAALAYLSGLAAYADNADNPMGSVLGGRRFLAPIVLVLLVNGWDRIEARIPEVAALGLHPQVLPAILGLLMYSGGKVISGLLPKGPECADPTTK